MAREIKAEVKRRLVGKTQAILARELGVSALTVHQALHGKVNPSPKLLKALGYRKVVVYEKVERAAPCEPAVKPKPAIGLFIPGNEGAPSYKLSPQLVTIALKYQVAPGVEWPRFLAALPDPTDLEAEWTQWCLDARQTAPRAQGKAIDAEPALEALGAPGELYSHLKPIQRGPDHRPAPLMGNVHPVIPEEPKP